MFIGKNQDDSIVGLRADEEGIRESESVGKGGSGNTEE